jgi:hypothetical protein
VDDVRGCHVPEQHSVGDRGPRLHDVHRRRDLQLRQRQVQNRVGVHRCRDERHADVR